MTSLRTLTRALAVRILTGSRRWHTACLSLLYELHGRHVLKRSGPSAFANRWWYYSVELANGTITHGQYESDLPFLRRMMLRRCDLGGAACLDLGTMEAMIPVLLCRSGASRVLAVD